MDEDHYDVHVSLLEVNHNITVSAFRSMAGNTIELLIPGGDCSCSFLATSLLSVAKDEVKIFYQPSLDC